MLDGRYKTLPFLYHNSFLARVKSTGVSAPSAQREAGWPRLDLAAQGFILVCAVLHLEIISDYFRLLLIISDYF